jgi:hypothetical protein
MIAMLGKFKSVATLSSSKQDERPKALKPKEYNFEANFPSVPNEAKEFKSKRTAKCPNNFLNDAKSNTKKIIEFVADISGRHLLREGDFISY